MNILVVDDEKLIRWSLKERLTREGHTVTEAEDGEDPGSMINFVLVADKVRFDVALPPAEAGGLKISSRLLAVARKVLAGAS